MWQQSEYHKFARKLVYFISVIIDMRGGWGCVWNTHTCPLLVSLKPAKACPVNRFAKKTWHDLLSPRQFTSCEIVYMCTQWNSDHITWQVRLWRVLNNSANTQSVEFRKVLHHLSQNVIACSNSSWFSVWLPCWSLVGNKLFLWWGNWVNEGTGGLRRVKGFRS